jgi:phospholipase/carboxylesterase
MSEILPAIEIETAANPAFSVIWLHGLGADGNDFVSIVPELGLPADRAVRFIFPHAPRIPVTVNNGYVMRAWYDIEGLDEDSSRRADEAGILASSAAIRRLIERENTRGVPTGRIVLAGFSQGGAMAYTAGLSYPETLAGIIALSAYIPAPKLLTENLNAANRQTPIFAAHGSADDVLPLQLGELAHTTLQQLGYSIEWHTYPMPHSVCLPEIIAIGRWLSALLPDR